MDGHEASEALTSVQLCEAVHQREPARLVQVQPPFLTRRDRALQREKRQRRGARAAAARQAEEEG